MTKEFADDPAIPPATFRQIHERLTNQLHEAEGQLAEALTAEHRIELDPKDVQRAWDKLTTEQKRTVIRDSVTVKVLPFDKSRDRRRFDPKAVELRWKYARPTPVPKQFIDRTIDVDEEQ